MSGPRATAALSALVLVLALTVVADDPGGAPEPAGWRRAWSIPVEPGTGDEGSANSRYAVSESALAVATPDGTVTVHDVRTGERRGTIRAGLGSPAPVSGVWVTSDTLVVLKSAAEPSRHTLYAYDLVTGAALPWRTRVPAVTETGFPLVMVNPRGIVLAEPTPGGFALRSLDLRSGATKARTVHAGRCELGGAASARSMMILTHCGGSRVEVIAVDPATLLRAWSRRLPSFSSLDGELPPMEIAAGADGYVHAQTGDDGYFFAPDGRLLSTNGSAVAPIARGAGRPQPIYVGSYPSLMPPGYLDLNEEWPLPLFLLSVDPVTGRIGGLPLDLSERSSTLVGTAAGMAFVYREAGDEGLIIAYRLVHGDAGGVPLDRWPDACALLNDRDLRAAGSGYRAVPGNRRTPAGWALPKPVDCEWIPAGDEDPVISLSVEWVSSSGAAAHELFTDEVRRVKGMYAFDPTTESPTLFSYTMDTPGGYLGRTLVEVGPVIIQLTSPSRRALRLVAPLARENLQALYGSPARDGSSKERNGWSHPTDRTVYPDPVIVDGVVYAGSGDGRIYALDAVSGAERWVADLGSSVLRSPAVADGGVYAHTVEGKIVALDARSGRSRWSVRKGEVSGPVVVAGRVYVGTDQSEVIALDADSGTELWTFRAGGRVDYPDPVVADGIVYVIGDGTVYALDAASGRQRWRFRAGGQEDGTDVTVRDGVAYVGASHGAVYALDAVTGAVRWRSRVGVGDDASPPVVADGIVYAGNDYATYALEATSGKRLWSLVDAPADDVNFGWDLAASPGVVYVGNVNGQVTALDAATGATRWSHRVAGGLVGSAPTLGAGDVYACGRDGRVYALDAATGALKWSYHTGGEVTTRPVVAGRFVYVGGSNGNVFALPVEGP